MSDFIGFIRNCEYSSDMSPSAEEVGDDILFDCYIFNYVFKL